MRYALKWIIGFKLVPDTDVFRAYVERIANRPAAVKVAEHDARLAAEHAHIAAGGQQA